MQITPYLKFIRIVLAILIVVGLGLLASQKLWVPKVVEKILGNDNLYKNLPITKDTKNQIFQNKAPHISTNNWQIYTNKKFGFSFKYPGNFKVSENYKNPDYGVFSIGLNMKYGTSSPATEVELGLNDINLYFNNTDFHSVNSSHKKLNFKKEYFNGKFNFAAPFSFYKETHPNELVADFGGGDTSLNNKNGWLLDGKQGSSDRVAEIKAENWYGLEGETTFGLPEEFEHQSMYSVTSYLFEVNIVSNKNNNNSVSFVMPEGDISQNVFEGLVYSFKFIDASPY